MRKTQSGQGLVEYGLILGLISVLVIAVFLSLGGQFRSLITAQVAGTETMGQNQAALSAGIY